MRILILLVLLALCAAVSYGVYYLVCKSIEKRRIIMEKRLLNEETREATLREMQERSEKIDSWFKWFAFVEILIIPLFFISGVSVVITSITGLYNRASSSEIMREFALFVKGGILIVYAVSLLHRRIKNSKEEK